MLLRPYLHSRTKCRRFINLTERLAVGYCPSCACSGVVPPHRNEGCVFSARTAFARQEASRPVTAS
eukprot:30945-Eustigmatos_ZCMA.PRE.1